MIIMTNKLHTMYMTTRSWSFPLRGSSFCLGVVLTIAQWACTKKEIRTIPVPVITGVSKTILFAGDTLVISGTGFNPVAAGNLVAISSFSLQVISASASRLEVVIPPGLRSGQLTVSFPGGQSVAYPDNIHITDGTQPLINSVVPTIVNTGDTIVIRGKNFGMPSNANGVLISGIPCKILNATDSVILAAVPENAHSGKLTITTNGSTSLPVNFTVLRPDPLADGRICWGYTYKGGLGFDPLTQIFRGVDSILSYPYGTTAYTNNNDAEFPKSKDYGLHPGSTLDPLLNDAQGNIYYLYNIGGPYGSFTTKWQLIRLAPANGSFTRTVIWNQDFADAPTTQFYPDPSDPYDYADIPNTPDALSIDGNKVYIKLGISDNYYTADLSLPNPGFTQTKGLVPDSVSYGLQFTPNYIFYKTLGSDDYFSMNLLVDLRYVRRSGGTPQIIPTPPREKILTTLADNNHGDNILIITQEVGGKYGMKIYKFNALTQTMQLLYGPDNWADSPANTGPGQPLSLLWAGTHIYYSRNNTSNTGYGLYLLNDDGSTTRTLNVYPQLDGLSHGSRPSLPLFISKK